MIVSNSTKLYNVYKWESWQLVAITYFLFLMFYDLTSFLFVALVKMKGNDIKGCRSTAAGETISN